MPEISDSPSPPAKSNWLQMVELLRPHWKAMSLALVAVLGETITDLLDPWPLKIIVDNLLQSKPLPPWLAGIVSHLGQNKLAVLNFAVLAVAIIAIIGAISSYTEKYLTTSVGQWVMHDLRRTLYQHIHHLSLAEHDEKRTGDLISRVTSDIEAVQDFITSAMLGMLVNALTLAGMVAVMFYYNWRFALIALSIAPALFLVVLIFTKRIKKASRAMRQKEGELANIVQEVFTSIRVVKAFAREDYEQDRFEKQSLENVDTALQARSIKAKLSPMVEVLAAVGHLPGPGIRRPPGAGRPTQRGRSDYLPGLFRQDVQAHAGSLQDGGHGLQGDGKLRTHPGSIERRQPGARSAPSAARPAVQRQNGIRSRLFRVQSGSSDFEGNEFSD